MADRILPVGWPTGKRRYLTRTEALRRMKAGDLPTQGGGYTSALHFSDGARTTGRTGWQLLRAGLIERPAHSSVSSPYTLATPTDTDTK